MPGSRAIEGIGTLVSLSVVLAFVNGIGVEPLPGRAYLFGVALYLGGLVTGYGLSLGNE